MTDETVHQPDDRPVPALYDWAKKVYDKMLFEAKPEGDENDELDEPQMVYEGHLTNLHRELGVPNPHYTAVMRALKAGGCVVQIRRGGGTAMSKWALLKEPDPDAFVEAAGRRMVNRSKVGILEQRLNDLQKLVVGLREEVDGLKEAINGR